MTEEDLIDKIIAGAAAQYITYDLGLDKVHQGIEELYLLRGWNFVRCQRPQKRLNMFRDEITRVCGHKTWYGPGEPLPLKCGGSRRGCGTEFGADNGASRVVLPIPPGDFR